jgi:hypothetical protein
MNTTTTTTTPRGRKWHRVRIAAIAALGVVPLAAVTMFAAGVFSPSYPHPWCGPLIAQLHTTGGSQQSFESALQGIQKQDHAPIGKLLTDLYNYDAANAAEQNDNNFSALGAIGGALGALNTVSGDLKALNLRCAQPPTAYRNDSI